MLRSSSFLRECMSSHPEHHLSTALFLPYRATYTVATGYNFVGGGTCDGTGQDCKSASCPEAVNNPTFPGGGIPVHFAGVNCTSPNVSLPSARRDVGDAYIS